MINVGDEFYDTELGEFVTIVRIDDDDSDYIVVGVWEAEEQQCYFTEDWFDHPFCIKVRDEKHKLFLQLKNNA